MRSLQPAINTAENVSVHPGLQGRIVRLRFADLFQILSARHEKTNTVPAMMAGKELTAMFVIRMMRVMQ